jgi:hypothetical protein
MKFYRVLRHKQEGVNLKPADLMVEAPERKFQIIRIYSILYITLLMML